MLGATAGAGMAACLLEMIPRLHHVLLRWHARAADGLLVVGALEGLLAALLLTRGTGAGRAALRVADLFWSRNDFCRGWYISGATGSGKTEALKLLMHLLCRAEKDWGGLLIDEKSFFADEVLPILGTYGRARDVRELRIRPEDAAADWRPPFCFNILGDDRVRTSQYVDALLVVAEAIACGRDDKGFFQDSGGVAHRGCQPALLLQAVDHFRKRYWNTKAQEQMEGVKGTITNYLRWFTDDAIHEVFGAEQANFTLSCMDEAKLICLSLPQRYAIERRYLCALLKVLAYAHARSRQPTTKTYNLMVIWQDEAQRFIMPVDGDVDILRQYQVTTVISTQFRAQLEKALGGKDQAAPIIGNLRNRIILQAADEDCAEESAKFIGKGVRRKRSFTRQQDGRRSTSYSDEVAYFVESYQLRQLPKFVGVFCHAGGQHRVLQFTPLDEAGRVPAWFGALALPLLRCKMAGGRQGPRFCRFVPPQVRIHR